MLLVCSQFFVLIISTIGMRFADFMIRSISVFVIFCCLIVFGFVFIVMYWFWIFVVFLFLTLCLLMCFS